jgi:hypothetical protein
LRERLKQSLKASESANASVMGILEALGRLRQPADAARPQLHGVYTFAPLPISNLATWIAAIAAVASDSDHATPRL